MGTILHLDSPAVVLKQITINLFICPEPLLVISLLKINSNFREVGFLRYWTSNNLGNFLLASPHLILSILATSKHIRTKHSFYTFLSNPLTPHVLALGAISTLLFTSMHVQIITRVLTAFPAIYWYVAEKVVEDLQGVWVERAKPWEGVVRVIVVFGCVGAVLYSAFLPPA